MQGAITTYRPQALEELQAQMDQQLAQIQATGIVATHGIRHLVQAHRATSALYRKTLAATLQQLQEAHEAGCLTTVQFGALYHSTEAYRYEMLMMAEQTGDALIDEFAQC